MKNKIVSRECRFVTHLPEIHNKRPDTHLIKEILHFEDGTSKPNLRRVVNYERPLWVTKEAYRNHKQKKEWEDESKLKMVMTTESNKGRLLSKLLNAPHMWNRGNELMANPYVYGADMLSRSFIKKEYLKKYPDIFTANTVCMLDIETDVVKGTKDILMITLVFGEKIFTVIDNDFVSGISDVKGNVLSCADKYIGEDIKENNLDIEIVVTNDKLDIVKVAFEQIHKWMPDFLAIWNMDFDINEITKYIIKHKGYPEDILCDPSLPPELRHINYKKGKTKKVTASGQTKPLNPSEQWHTLDLSASFYVIDAMCTYRRLRSPPGPEEPSYSLDFILGKELNLGKLKFDEANHVSPGLPWHVFMQSKFKIEYIVYNIFDAYAMEKLEKKNKDLSYTLPKFSNTSIFEKFSSQPKMIADAFFFYAKEEKNNIMGSVGFVRDTEVEMVEDEDDEDYVDTIENTGILSLKGWIVTLPSHMSAPGLKLLEDFPDIATNIRGYVADTDATAAYPTATEVGNVSKSTTVKELSKIKGIPEPIFRSQNMNLILGPVNSVEYATNMFKAPELEDILDLL